MRVFTVGHSTRTSDELVAILRAHRVERVVDVRRFPESRRHPQFGRERLRRTLLEAGLDYLWLEDLGGRRSRRPGSPHTAWRVAGFAAYADHMDTPAFAGALARLIEAAREGAIAVMCAEALPERCHRRLIADALTARGVEVVHLFDVARSRAHRLTDFARLEGARLRYDSGQTSLLPD